MDIVWLAAFLVMIGLALYAIERIPFPASPKWLKPGIEAFVVIAFLFVLAGRLGVDLIPHH